MGPRWPQYERGNTTMNQIECLHPTDLDKQIKNCMKCEILNTCPMVDFARGPEMKYLPLGKITYSNRQDYVGAFLEISEINYNRLKMFMDRRIIDHDFEKHLNDFSYHLIEEDVKSNISIERGNIFGSKEIIPSELLTTKIFTLFVFYTLNEKFSFYLFYDSKYPTQLPIKLHIKEIFDPNFKDEENGGNDNV